MDSNISLAISLSNCTVVRRKIPMHRACVQINLKHSNEQKTSQEFIIKLKASDTGGAIKTLKQKLHHIKIHYLINSAPIRIHIIEKKKQIKYIYIGIFRIMEKVELVLKHS